MKLKVTHVEGSKKGSVDTFDVPVLTVGRDPSNTLVFDPVKDDRVSTKHAALSEQGGGLIVTDMGSRNGTLVNGQKISGPTPVPSGGLVQFGENGPMILVSYEAAAAPKAAAPPPKKSSGGCAILGVAAFLGLLAVGAVVVFLYLRSGHKDPWAKYGPGSSFELAVETRAEKPVAFESKVTIKQTVLTRSDELVRIETQTTVSGNTTKGETDLPRHPKATDHKVEKPLEEKHESITVPAGTFECRYEKRKNGDTTSEVWTSDDVPVAIKSVTSTDGSKTTMTLVKYEKK